MNKKSLTEQTNEVLKSRMSAKNKEQALIKLGVSPYEAMVLSRTTFVVRTPRAKKTEFAFTFGVEIEVINCAPSRFLAEARTVGLETIDHTSQYGGCHRDIPQFKLVPDGSICGYEAAECVTPALDNNTTGFNSLKKCCQVLANIGARANSSCGLHVHIGARDLTDREYCNVFVNYMMLEQAINTFLARSRRSNDSRWCRSLTNNMSLVLSATTKSEMRQALGYDRYHRVNAEAYNRHQTIEFRQHQGTPFYTNIQHWVLFLGKLVEFSKTNRLSSAITRIEDIPFLSETEKNWFCARRAWFNERENA